jgi:hypothetical protein
VASLVTLSLARATTKYSSRGRVDAISSSKFDGRLICSRIL